MELVRFDEDNLYPKESKIILKIIKEQFDLLSDALDSVNSAFTFKVFGEKSSKVSCSANLILYFR
jgi:hypothetical protein